MTNNLEEIKKRVEAATKGPWRRYKPSAYEGNAWVEHLPPGSIALETLNGVGAFGQVVAAVPWNQKDAEFLASAREDVLALVAEVEELRAKLQASKSELDETYIQRDNFRFRAERAEADAVADSALWHKRT